MISWANSEFAHDITLKCDYDQCQNRFHIICGLFGDCSLNAKRNGNKIEFKFYCKQHKYDTIMGNAENQENSCLQSQNLRFDSLGEHLLSIKRLKTKLDRIKIINERINEYELTQRGIITVT